MIPCKLVESVKWLFWIAFFDYWLVKSDLSSVLVCGILSNSELSSCMDWVS